MYINTTTKETLTAEQIMQNHPNISFPNMGWDDSWLNALGYAELHEPTEHPFPNENEKLVEITPIIENNKWIKQYIIQPI